MSITLEGYLHVGCGDCGVELNPWLPYLFQRHAECSCVNEECDEKPALLCGIPSSKLAKCLCCETRPVLPQCNPGDPMHPAVGEGPFAWWYDPAKPEESGGAYGVIFHSFNISDPATFTASREDSLRSRVCLEDGLLLGEARIEIVGVDQRSTRYLYRQIKRRLEAFSPCCGQTMDVYEDCCEKDGETGLRRLTDVGEFNVVCLEDEPSISNCGLVVSIVFSAGALVLEPGASVDAEDAVLLGEMCLPNCPDGAVSVMEDVYAPPTTCTADIELQTDGSFKVCPVDYEAPVPDDCFLTIREVRAVDPSTILPCAIRVDLDLTGTDPVVEPLQPDLWQEFVLDPLTAGESLDCVRYPITVRQVTVPNPRFDPTCPECPASIRAEGCAETTPGLILDADGFIDLAAMGGFNVAIAWDSNDPVNTAPDPWMQALLDYYGCLGYSTDYAAILAAAQEGNPALDAVEIFVYGDGRVSLKPYMLGSTTQGCETWSYVWDAPGIPYSGPDGPSTCSSGTHTATPVQALEEAVNCGTNIPFVCLPFISQSPTGLGPCVTVTVNPDGTIATDLDSVDNDLTEASFTFAPCATNVTPDCPGIIPPNPCFIVDSVNGTAVGDGWEPGYLWPNGTTGDQYSVCEVDGNPNTLDPVISQQAVRYFADAACEAPCGPGLRRRAPRQIGSCFVCDDGRRQIKYAKVSGLSTTTNYRPEWSVTAGADPLLQPTVHFWAGPANMPPPALSDAEIRPYICASRFTPARFKKIGGYQTARFNTCGLQAQCGPGYTDALQGWVDASVPWFDPAVCGAECAYLIVEWPCGITEPDIQFAMIPTS